VVEPWDGQHPVAVGCYWPEGFPESHNHRAPIDYDHLSSDRIVGLPINHVLWRFEGSEELSISTLSTIESRMGIIVIWADPWDPQKFYRAAYATGQRGPDEPFFMTPPFILLDEN